MSGQKRAIIIDTDPGQDDAVAIWLALAASSQLDVLALTTVAGNVPLPQATTNALRLCAAAGAGMTRIHAGADRPLLVPLETAEFVCGKDGLDGAVELPDPRRAPDGGHAAQAIIDLVRRAGAGDVTICALGPLTNIALAFRLAPDILPKIREVVLMGGAMDLGNITPAAEFNIYVDPHAASMVFTAGVPITMFGLHVTHDVIASAQEIAAIAALGTQTSKSVVGMMTRRRAGGLGTAEHPLHDPCVIAHLLWGDLFAGRDCFVEVETSTGALRGRTTIDWNGRLQKTPNARVINQVDAPAFFNRLTGMLAKLP
jgi:purine nucleosidase